MASEPFVFASCPSHDELINRVEFSPKLRGIEATIVPHPSTEDGTHPYRYILQLQITSLMQGPAANSLSHSLGGLLADRRQKADEVFSITVDRRSWPECVAQKVESSSWTVTSAISILAVDDSGLLRMQYELTFRKPPLQRFA